MTREHIFARWLVLKVRGARLVPTTSPADATRIARLVAPVCAECNAGWMSGLEVGFRRLLFREVRAGLMPAPDRTTLARWSVKTAVLLAHAHGSELGSLEHRPEILTGIPSDLEVFVARRRRPLQRLDYRIGESDAGPSSVAVMTDDLVTHVAQRGTLVRRQGTQLWPLRTHALRWETI